MLCETCASEPVCHITNPDTGVGTCSCFQEQTAAKPCTRQGLGAPAMPGGSELCMVSLDRGARSPGNVFYEWQQLATAPCYLLAAGNRATFSAVLSQAPPMPLGHCRMLFPAGAGAGCSAWTVVGGHRSTLRIRPLTPYVGDSGDHFLLSVSDFASVVSKKHVFRSLIRLDVWWYIVGTEWPMFRSLRRNSSQYCYEEGVAEWGQCAKDCHEARELGQQICQACPFCPCCRCVLPPNHHLQPALCPKRAPPATGSRPAECHLQPCPKVMQVRPVPPSAIIVSTSKNHLILPSPIAL
mmetsp:Transcript_35202/g.85695  ORF Transcript_35202/g.85695 Transcript_35202/m.85695 type:complete len:296 (+) Transcript_35202:399-1286(+)